MFLKNKLNYSSKLKLFTSTYIPRRIEWNETMYITKLCTEGKWNEMREQLAAGLLIISMVETFQELSTKSVINLFGRIIAIDHILDGISHTNSSTGYLDPFCYSNIGMYFNNFEEDELTKIVINLVIEKMELMKRLRENIRRSKSSMYRMNGWRIYETIRESCLESDNFWIFEEDLPRFLNPYLFGRFPDADYIIECVRTKYGETIRQLYEGS